MCCNFSLISPCCPGSPWSPLSPFLAGGQKRQSSPLWPLAPFNPGKPSPPGAPNTPGSPRSPTSPFCPILGTPMPGYPLSPIKHSFSFLLSLISNRCCYSPGSPSFPITPGTPSSPLRPGCPASPFGPTTFGNRRQHQVQITNCPFTRFAVETCRHAIFTFAAFHALEEITLIIDFRMF